MKKHLILFFALLIYSDGFCQDITGAWNGLLKVQGIELRVVFNITKTDEGYTSTMDSPDQGAMGIAVTTTTFENQKIKLQISSAKNIYNGDWMDGKITGTFTQAGQNFPLNLSHDKIEKAAPKLKPQDPIQPYPYYSEDVFFMNKKAKVKLAGTLTLPKKDGVYPVVILITGSGPQNRNEELLGHKPFLVLSDYLTRKGIAVLRYDDRGTAQSTGNFAEATSEDFATDAKAAIAYLKTRPEIKKDKIGLMGHSEGGLIAPMVAAKSKDVDFIVLLAGTGIPGNELLLLQTKLIAKADSVNNDEINQSLETNKGAFEIVIASKSPATLEADLTKYMKERFAKSPMKETPKGWNEDDYIKGIVRHLTNPWMQYFIKYDPATALVNVKCPVLAVNGEKDLQVPPNENLTAIKAAIQKGGNQNVTTMEFKNLNHLFQNCETGSPGEYAEIDQTFSPDAMKEIADWVLKIID